MRLFKPHQSMTPDEIKSKADGIVDGYENSGFAGPDDLRNWIVSAMTECARRATAAEHDRIEQYIGTRKATEIRTFVNRCKLKWK